MASGMRLMREINDQLLSCKLCEGQFREPKTLTCMHTFCMICLQTQFDTEAEGRSGRYNIYLRHVTCPVCQKRTELPAGGVKRLPDNFLVSNLTDALAKRVDSEVLRCDICLTVKSRTVEAKSKCLDCNKQLCANCLQQHRSTKVTQHHSIVDLQEEKNIQCKVHEEEHVRYYCSNCEACICVLCTLQEHRDHDVCAFSEVSDQHRDELSGMLGECQGRLTEVTERLDILSDNEKAVLEARDRIKDMAIAYVKQVRLREKELLQDLNSLVGGVDITEEKTRLQMYKADLDSCCKLTDVMLREQGVEVLLVKKDIKSKMSTLLGPQGPKRGAIDLKALTFVPGDVTFGELNLGGEEVPRSTQPLSSSQSATSGTDSDSGDREVNIAASVEQSLKATLQPMTRQQNLGSNQSLDQAIAPVRTEPTNTPDLLSSAPSYSGRKIFSRRIQTDITSVDPSSEISKMNDAEFTQLLKLKPVEGDSQANRLPESVSNDIHARRARRRAAAAAAREAEKKRFLMEEKFTETDEVEQSDQETCTVSTVTESRSMLTDQISTCDRATDSFTIPTQHRAVGTIAIRKDSVAAQVTPRVSTVTTNTPVTTQSDQECQTIDYENLKVTSSNHYDPMTTSAEFSNEGGLLHPSSAAAMVTRDTASDPITFPNTCKATETTKIRVSTQATETTTVKKCDQTTATISPKTLDSWTETPMPQMVSTGITPPRPATLEAGVSTIPIITSDEATGTDVKTYRDTQTEMVLLVCDNETITDNPGHVDAQTSMEIVTESAGCGTDSVEITTCESMTDILDELEIREEYDVIPENVFGVDVACGGEVPCGIDATTGVMSHSPSPQPGEPCSKCGHIQSGFSTPKGNSVDNELSPSKEIILVVDDSDSLKKTSDGQHTQDVGTMAMSYTPYGPTWQDIGVQTPQPCLHDKGSLTSGDWEKDMCLRPLSKEHQDAATSTESLNYIGLLSEIDVDELIVVPEAAFELVSDSDSEDDVIMVDTQTSTDFIQCVEEGTQTKETPNVMTTSEDVRDFTSSPSPSKKCIGSIIKSLVDSEGGGSPFKDDVEKHLVSIGVNTESTFTLEKETCTSMRHLFSKGTMTFYVSQMDKSTSTLGQPETLKPSPTALKSKSADKVTMTCQTDRKDVAIETDSTPLDDRITACISKLRNVSEKLNSPTQRKTSEGSLFFPQASTTGQSPIHQKSELLGPDDVLHHLPHASPETCRQQAVQNLLEQAGVKLRQKDNALPMGRKPQPITTLKGRRPSQPNPQLVNDINPVQPEDEDDCDGTQSLNRKLKSERTGVVKMGSQPLTASRLPLLRYNSAPGRIATVPTQTLLNKAAETAAACSQNGRQGSPSKTLITNTQCSQEYELITLPLPESQKEEKSPVPVRRVLPSITETRTSSSCSDASLSSFMSANASRPASDHVDIPSSLTNSGVFPPSLSNTPLLGPDLLISVPMRSDGSPSPATSMPPSPRPLSHTTSNSSLDRDKSSSTTTPRGSNNSLNSTKGTEEKEKSKKGGLGFMQRLLSKKRKSSESKKTKTKACTPAVPTTEAIAALSEAVLPPPPGPEESYAHGAILQLPAHHYPPLPEPRPASPPPPVESLVPPHSYPPLPEPKEPPKPRQFIIVGNRVVPITQDKLEERRGSKDITAASQTEVECPSNECPVTKRPTPPSIKRPMSQIKTAANGTTGASISRPISPTKTANTISGHAVSRPISPTKAAANIATGSSAPRPISPTKMSSRPSSGIQRPISPTKMPSGVRPLSPGFGRPISPVKRPATPSKLCERPVTPSKLCERPATPSKIGDRPVTPKIGDRQATPSRVGERSVSSKSSVPSTPMAKKENRCT